MFSWIEYFEGHDWLYVIFIVEFKIPKQKNIHRLDIELIETNWL